MNFAQVVKVLRKRKGVYQKQLAEILGLTQQTVAKWECNNAEPSIKTLCGLADFFDVTADQLLGRAPLPDENEGNEEKAMAEDQTQRLADCLLDFVERVAKGGATTEAEVQVLPEVAQVLVNLRRG